MRVVIHGATNLSNFGDILFAKLFYERCIKNGFETDFYYDRNYGIGEFCRKELGYYRKCGVFGLVKSDAMIMMSGGYLGEDNKSISNTIKRYFRFILPAKIFLLTKKPLYIIGVGGGPLFSKFLQKTSIDVLNRAKVLIVRDQETRDYFQQYGCKNEITVTTDTAINICDYILPELFVSDTLKEIMKKNKIVLLHLVYGTRSDELIHKKIIPALIRFLDEHSEYQVIVSTDGDPEKDVTKLVSYLAIPKDRVHAYKYYDCMQLCSLINEVDFVITMKLHVGIIASTLGKSVVSFPIHREKVGRFYDQIGEPNRSVNMLNCTPELVYDKIKEFYNVPIVLSDDLRNKAKLNLIAIDNIESNS